MQVLLKGLKATVFHLMLWLRGPILIAVSLIYKLTLFAAIVLIIGYFAADSSTEVRVHLRHELLQSSLICAGVSFVFFLVGQCYNLVLAKINPNSEESQY
jgi:hypothetical protein